MRQAHTRCSPVFYVPSHIETLAASVFAYINFNDRIEFRFLFCLVSIDKKIGILIWIWSFSNSLDSEELQRSIYANFGTEKSFRFGLFFGPKNNNDCIIVEWSSDRNKCWNEKCEKDVNFRSEFRHLFARKFSFTIFCLYLSDGIATQNVKRKAIFHLSTKWN